MTRLLIALAKKGDLESLIEDLPEPLEAEEIRLKFKAGVDFKSLGANVLKDFEAFAGTLPYLSLAPNNFEGVRVNFDREHGDGWALLRMSLHEPIMPINLESGTKGGNAKIKALLAGFLKQYDFLETGKAFGGN